MIEKYYTIKEASAILGVSKVTMHSWENQGKIKFTRLSSKVVRIAESELKRVLNTAERKNE